MITDISIFAAKKSCFPGKLSAGIILKPEQNEEMFWAKGI